MRKTFIAAIGLAALTVGCATPVQILYDAEVDRLCAKDGGIEIFETAPTPPEHFNEYGQLRFFKPWERENALGPQYRYVDNTQYIRGTSALDSTSLTRHVTEVYRRSDGKLLGTSVWYGRGGGDIPLGFHPSGYRCPANLGSLLKQIFVLQKPSENAE